MHFLITFKIRTLLFAFFTSIFFNAVQNMPIFSCLEIYVLGQDVIRNVYFKEYLQNVQSFLSLPNLPNLKDVASYKNRIINIV